MAPENQKDEVEEHESQSQTSNRTENPPSHVAEALEKPMDSQEDVSDDAKQVSRAPETTVSMTGDEAVQEAAADQSLQAQQPTQPPSKKGQSQSGAPAVRLDMDLDVQIEMKAKVEGDITLSLP